MSPLLLATIVTLRTADGLKVSTSVSERSPFVGQGVEIRVGVVAEDRRPTLVLPRLEGAAATRLGEDFRRFESSTVGDVASVKNLFVWRFRITPARSGRLEIPPFRAILDGASGLSERATLTVKPLPQGRPAGFLGGVGAVSVKVEVDPTDVRMGDELEYRVALEGPGAIGSTEPPDLSRIESSVVRPRIVPLGIDVVDEPPRRVFRYRLRPTVAGEARLPGPMVAWLDPASGRYQTSSARSAAVTVHEVPRFDPGSIVAPAVEPRRRSLRVSAQLLAALAAIPVTVVLARFMTARVRRRARGAREVAAIRATVERASESTLADTVAEALSRSLRLSGEDEVGELSPREIGARSEILGLEPELGARLEELARECERARFDPAGATAPDLRARTVAVLKGLAESHGSRPPTRLRT